MLVRRWVQVGVVLFLCLVASAAHARRLAVLELRGSLDRESLAAFTNAVRSAAVDSLRGTDVSVMTRENMAVLLQDMGLDVDCVEGACEVETGRNLGAQLVVAGEVLRIEDKLIADLKLYETESGSLLATERAIGDGELQLLGKLEPAGAALFRRVSSAPERERPPVQEGAIGDSDDDWLVGAGEKKIVVSFESSPAGAIVRLDGQLLCQGTPCSREVSPGPHEVLMEKERYHPTRTRRDLERGAAISLELPPRFGWLSVRTEPPGLPLSINGQRTDGWTRQEVDPGPYEIVVQDRCWKRLGQRVSVDEGGEEDLVIQGSPRQAGIKLRARDAEGNALDGEVRVDGQLVGRTPGTFKVQMCAERLEVRTEDGRRASHQLTLREKEVEEIDLVVSGKPQRSGSTQASRGRSSSGTSRSSSSRPSSSSRSSSSSSRDSSSSSRNKVLSKLTPRQREGRRAGSVFLMFGGGFLAHAALLATNGTHAAYQAPPVGTQAGVVSQFRYDQGRTQQGVYLGLSGVGLGLYGLGVGVYASSAPAPSAENVKRSAVLLVPAIAGFVVSGVVAGMYSPYVAGFDPFSFSASGVGFMVGMGALTPFLTVAFSHADAKRRGVKVGEAGRPRPGFAVVPGPASLHLSGWF